jgi:hypothetical protein
MRRVRTKFVTAVCASGSAVAGAMWLSRIWLVSAEAARNACTSAGPTERFRAKAVGTVPMRISMMSPIPFCPSFEPWKKLTPVQVATISARIGHGGGCLPSGAR